MFSSHSTLGFFGTASGTLDIKETRMVSSIGNSLTHITMEGSRQMKQMDSFPVVFMCDENYAMPTAVAITTLRASKKKSTRYCVYVLGVDLSEDSRKRILSLSGDGFSVSVLDKSLSEQQRSIAPSRNRITQTALLKFDLPALFPEYERLLYLDSDMVIQKDLTALFLTNIDDVYAAVVKDTITINQKYTHYLKSIQFKGDFYFNSGMMLLNLENMRNAGLPQKLLDYRLHGKNHFMDQDALNVVFSGKVKWVSPYYNLLNCFFEWQSIEDLSAFYGEEFPLSTSMIYADAAILHFGDVRKPWACEMGYLSALYMSYFKLSPYADTPLFAHDTVAQAELLAALEREARALDKVEQLERKTNEIYRSFTYRTGKIVTWLPRTLMRGIHRF